jgi:hypothetical protein
VIGVMKPQRCGSQNTLHWNSYCGACKMIGTEYGSIYRTGVNFDLSIVATLAAETNGYSIEAAHIKPRKCFTTMELPTNQERLFKFIAALHLVWYDIKLADMHTDDGSRGAAWLRRSMNNSTQKALQHLQDAGVPLTNVDALLTEQHQLEQTDHPEPLSAYAHPTASLAALFMKHAVLSGGTPSEDRIKLAEAAGYEMGKALYLHDACMDLKDDLKKNRFNPFVNCSELQHLDFESRQLAAADVARHSWSALETAFKRLIQNTDVLNDSLTRIAMVRETLPGSQNPAPASCSLTSYFQSGATQCKPSPAMTTAATSTVLTVGLPAAALAQSSTSEDCLGAICGCILCVTCCGPILYFVCAVLDGITNCICDVLCCFANNR